MENFLPCPFCGGKPYTYDLDDDGWIKTVVVKCEVCFATVEGRVDWEPFSHNHDRAGFNAAVLEEQQRVWNKRI